jgi:hypothetical protein
VRGRLVLLVATALVAAGAGSASADAPHTYSIPGYGIGVGLPSTWKSVNYRQILKPGVLQAFARDNPELAGSFAAMAQPNSPIKFFAYDPQVANGFATNVNLVVVPIGARLSFSEYSRRLIGELRSVSSVSGLRSATVHLPAGQATRISYRLSVTVQSRQISVLTLQYAFLRGGRSVVFTYTTLPANSRFYNGVFATSVHSIRFN